MSWHGARVLVVVPARGGSKSIPRKNLCEVGGLSLVARAAEVARALPWVDAAVLSTDDDEIASEGRKHGLVVPGMRPPELAHDTATSADMWKHAWLTAEAHYGGRFDTSLLLEPTSPMRVADDIERVMCALDEGDHGSAATVTRTPAHFTPEKTLRVSSAGLIEHYLPPGRAQTIRQKIPPYFHRNGICYGVRRKTLVEQGEIISADCAAVIVDREVVNIDHPHELELARWLLSRAV